ncbi:MAG: GNAT family N-acetyltransferase [Lachnospiraceae bacterium]|nr:GNAT family N-acetyltransferase [Lachnospiraceae bacterium]
MIRKATPQDIPQVTDCYTELLLHEQEHGAYTVWQLGVYPTEKTAEKGIADGDLYVMEQDGEICASVIANQLQPEEYGSVQWKYSAAPNEVFVIHLLCVRPSKAGRGIGKALVQFAAEEGKRRNCRAVRLDTGAQNKPAVALYTKLGFELAGTADMAIGGLIAHKNHLFFEKNIADAR